jgi:hypothetical protein
MIIPREGHDVCICEQRDIGALSWASFTIFADIRAAAPMGTIWSSSPCSVREAVLTGQGFAISSRWMFAPELASGEVVPVLEEWELPPMDLWVIYPSGRLTSTKARTFMTIECGPSQTPVQSSQKPCLSRALIRASTRLPMSSAPMHLGPRSNER